MELIAPTISYGCTRQALVRFKSASPIKSKYFANRESARVNRHLGALLLPKKWGANKGSKLDFNMLGHLSNLSDLSLCLVKVNPREFPVQFRSVSLAKPGFSEMHQASHHDPQSPRRFRP